MTITHSAPAKLNLSLEVLGKRSDGYHEIRSVLQAIDLCDTLTFDPADSVTLTCNIPELVTPDNLVLRAAGALRAAFPSSRGAAIHLEKRIPLASGLGGGSSDAAKTLLGLAELWGLAWIPLDLLTHLGEQLGMDVPFFLHDGTALVEGRGEQVTPLTPLPVTWFVLLHPAIVVPGKTARMYGSLSPDHYTSGKPTNALVNVLFESAPLLDSLLFNVFESVARQVFPGLDGIRRQFEAVSGRPAHVSGAGPTLFCLATGEDDARQVRDSFERAGFEAYACKSWAAK